MDESRIGAGEVLWGRYKVEELLGEGGMGQVWAATDTKLKRPVAIKIIRRRFADHPEYNVRFQREAEAVSRLKHPNLVQVYDVDGSPDGRLYIVMERIPGVPLRALIEASKRIDLVSAVYIAIQVAAGLGAAHAIGIWHRDIKPENIMVSEEGQVWVLDFGIAIQRRGADDRAMLRRGKRRGTGRLGTAGYMPPEEVLNQTADQRGDFYQLGVVLYEMISGRKPYPDADEHSETEMLSAHAFSEPRPLMEIVPDCPEWIWSIVARLLAKDPSDRYDDEEELIADLRTGLRESVPPGHPMAWKIDQDRHEQARKKAFSRRASLKSIPAEGAAPSASPSSPELRGSGGTEPMLGGWASTGPVEDKAAASKRAPPSVTKPLPPDFVPSSPYASGRVDPKRAAVEVTAPLPQDFVPAPAPPTDSSWKFALSPPAVPPPSSFTSGAAASPRWTIETAAPASTAPATLASAAPATPASAAPPPAARVEAVIPPPVRAPAASVPAIHEREGHSAAKAEAALMPAGAGSRAGSPERAPYGLHVRLPESAKGVARETPPARRTMVAVAAGMMLAAVMMTVLQKVRSAAPPAREDGMVVASASVSAPAPVPSMVPASIATAEARAAVEPAVSAAVVATPSHEIPTSMPLARSEPSRAPPSSAAAASAAPVPSPAPPRPRKSAPAVPMVVIGGKAIPADQVPLFGKTSGPARKGPIEDGRPLF